MAGGGIVVVEVDDVVDDSHRVVSEDDCEEAVAPMLMLLCGVLNRMYVSLQLLL